MIVERVRRIVTPPSAGEPPPPWTEDGSVLLLLASNIAALIIAQREGWSVWSLMTLYWAQGVIIGVVNVFRILALERFSTADVDGSAACPTPALKVQVAAIFAGFYGGLHLVYFIFVTAHTGGQLEPWFWSGVAIFALNHLWSYFYNRALDRRGTPKLGAVAFAPVLRVLPMNLIVIFGNLFAPGASLLLFGSLKIAADIGMHVFEHPEIRNAGGTTRA